MRHTNSVIQKRKFEESSVTSSLENVFKKKRGYVFRMPKPDSEVLLLVSGGLDSILIWGFLMERYHLKVHPLFLNKGEQRASREENSLDYFSRFYSSRYPSHFIQPVKETIYLPQKEILQMLKTPYDNLLRYERQTIRGYNPYTTTNIFLGSPGLVPLYAMLHSRFLELRENKKIRTIFSSIMLHDGDMCPSQTLTSIRTVNLAMCAFTGDYAWQFTSPSVEPYLGYFYGKSDLIKWGSKLNIPMERTWSCYRGLRFHCGRCLACDARKHEFKKARIPDRTHYSRAFDYSIRISNRLRRIFSVR